MKDLTSPALIKVKGILFLVIGILSLTLLMIRHPQPQTLLLVGLAIWSFCRFYYFAFYVIERYVDPTYKFSGLSSLVRYVLRKKKAQTGMSAP